MGKSYKGEYGSKYRRNPHLKNRKQENKKIQRALKQLDKNSDMNSLDD